MCSRENGDQSSEKWQGLKDYRHHSTKTIDQIVFLSNVIKFMSYVFRKMS